MDWFISDTHFNHENIIKLANRPFSSAEEMDEVMIRNWNARVQPEDTVIHLGDFGLPLDYAKEVLDRLNGRKILILGNHDRAVEKMQWAGFHEVYKEMAYGPNEDTRWMNFTLTHKPPVLSSVGGIILCGHIHQQFYYQGNNLNMSVEVWGYQPVSMREIIDRINWLQSNVFDTNTQMKIFKKGFDEIHPPIPGGLQANGRYEIENS